MVCRFGERNTVVSAGDARTGAIRLEAKGLGRRNPKGDAWLLRGANLKLEGGDRLAIVGPSGAGKTVLLRSLAMLDPHDEGQIIWQGRTVRGDEVPRFRTQVMFLHQRPALFEGSVEANLQQPYELKETNQRGRIKFSIFISHTDSIQPFTPPPLISTSSKPPPTRRRPRTAHSSTPSSYTDSAPMVHKAQNKILPEKR